MVSNYLEGRDVILHAENGVLGYGRMVSEESEIDPDIYNAAGQFVALNAGASFFDSVASFEMARGGRIDTVILGAYEVDQQGSVANWSTADAKRGGIGGAQAALGGRPAALIVRVHEGASAGAGASLAMNRLPARIAHDRHVVKARANLGGAGER